MEIRVTGVPLYRQQLALTCEEAAVAMATRGRITEAQLLAVMPRHENPFLGIRGDPASPDFGGLDDYGVYAQGLQKGLSVLGIKSLVLHRQTIGDFEKWILKHLTENRPVIWWLTWRLTHQRPVNVRLSDGAVVRLVPFEHVGVVVAANQHGMTYHDPWDATVQFAQWIDFKRVSGYFDNMALVIE